MLQFSSFILHFIKNKFYLLTTFITILLMVYVYRDLFFIYNEFFTFHDQTQLARISEYSLSLANFHFPPRIAPNMSFGLGHPMLGLYAPISYIFASIFYLITKNIIASLSFSWIIAITIGAIGMYLLISQKIHEYIKFTHEKQIHLVSLIGAMVYIFSKYFALDIFVRGNLAEVWFMGLFPLVLYLIFKNKKTHEIASLSILFAMFLLSHNALPYLSLPFVLLCVLLTKQKFVNFISLIIGGLISSFFWLPLIFENGLTHAKEIALKTYYLDHFLCPWQLIHGGGPWRFGASLAGCDDGMVFALGIIQLLFLLISIVIIPLYIYKDIKKAKTTNQPKKLIEMGIFYILLIGTVFMTLNYSSFIWKTFEKYLALLQFPWRFLSLSVFGLSFLGSIGLYIVLDKVSQIKFSRFRINLSLREYLYFLIYSIFCILIIIFSNKYFHGSLIKSSVLLQTQASTNFIQNDATYSYLELTPKEVDMKYYQKFHPLDRTQLPFNVGFPAEGKNIKIIQNSPFKKVFVSPAKDMLIVNIHKFPNWRIFVNKQPWYPTEYDNLARPIWNGVSDDKDFTFEIKYEQTPFQKAGNILSLIGIIITILIWSYKCQEGCQNIFYSLSKN